MATSLRAFQAEIDTIAHQKQAQHLLEIKAAQQAADEKHHKGHRSAQPASSNSKGKENLEVRKPAKKDGAEGGEKVKPQAEGEAAAGFTEGAVIEEEEDLAPEPTIEDILHEPLPATVAPEDDPLRTTLAHALLKNHGEVVLFLGAHPAPSVLYAATPISADETSQEGSVVQTVGKPIKDLEELARMRARLEAAVKGINGQMAEIYLNTQEDTATTPTTNDATAANPGASAAPKLPTIHTHLGPYGAYMLRLPPSGVQDITEVRVAVVGNVDAGKSTMLGVLTRGGLDDGRGKARVALFRHKHEIETGRTSSVGMEILGFSPTSEAVIPTGHVADISAGGVATFTAAAKREKMAWDEVCSKAAKVVTFIDLAGHERYLKTTLFGLTGCSPDYVMLIVGGNAGLIGMSKEHLGVALALQVPVIICVTKIDMTPAHVLEQTIKQLVKVLKSPGCRKVPVFVETAEQAVNCAKYLTSERICPIFLVSNVTGANLPKLRTMLNVLPSCQMTDKYEVDAPFEFMISDVFSVPFSGSVASGVITSGHVKAGDAVLLGPDTVGQFIPTVIKSIQRKRAPVEEAEAGQSVSFALKKIRRAQLRKGQVIIAKTEPPPKAVKRFEGQVLILYHNTTIQPRYQAVCHVNSVRQTVRIVSLDHPKGLLRTGDRAKVVFEFVQGPEYIREGAKMLFREGKTRGLGVVTKILPG